MQQWHENKYSICLIFVMLGSRRFCRRVSNSDNFFWEKRGSKYNSKGAIIGPPAKHHLKGVSLAGGWWSKIECWLGTLWCISGSRPVLLHMKRIPYFFWYLSGTVRTPAPSRPTHDFTKDMLASCCFNRKVHVSVKLHILFTVYNRPISPFPFVLHSFLFY